MVNEKKNIKVEILRILYLAKGETISGVNLSDSLNISRVAVWKHIKALKKSGVDVESRPMGYGLLNHDDLLLPFCFKEEFQKKIFHFQELETTMDKAKFLAKDNVPHLSVVIAENQIKGRGRLNRKWVSAKGGLWVTLILKPDTPPPLAYIYNFAASLSLSKSLKGLFDVNVSVKWPNDLLLNGKKLAGLLSEMETRGDMVEFLNIGIGINVNNQPQKKEPKAIVTILSKIPSNPIIRKFIIKNDNGTYSSEFISLLDAYYLYL